MNLRKPLTILATAAALGLVACGGDDESSGLSKADLAKQADVICQTAKTASLKITAPADFGQPTSDPAEAAAYLEKIAPITRKEATDLKALEPADDVKADWDAFTAKESELADFLDGLLAKAKAKDESGLKDLERVPQLGAEFSAAATKIGASGCAKG
ncbi:hypothetical protein DSM112329_01042 [Paraconexibacter sp. AEG42_29]|uniref:Uncharacterized protein n=1 Tax=Paraconexibacter sp. AEG42_29 TaxID=2997339 RepID=A0AAU7ARD4_9ACTN